MAQGPQTNPIDVLRSQVSQMLNSQDQNAPIAAIVLFEVNESKINIFLQNADALTQATRRLQGCNVFSFHRSLQPKSNTSIEYLIYEDWETVALFQHQWNSDHLRNFQYSVGDLIVAAPDLRFYTGWYEYQTQFQHAAPPRASADSAFSFPWAMSLFGAQQALNLTEPSKVAKAFDNVSRAAEAELGDTLKAVFRIGNALQTGLIDLALGPFGGQTFDAGRWAADVMRPAAAASEAWRPVQGAEWSPSPPQPAPAPPVVSPSPQPATQTAPSNLQTQAAQGWGPIPYPDPRPDPVVQQGPAVQSSSHGQGASPPQSFAEPNISPNFPYEPHYADVFGSRMHYIKQGKGETILLLHGNPSWSYAWRNIIPHLSPLGECIAPDLIGFGRSAKPKIQYHWFEHARYLEAFIQTLGLENITLVLHDQGSALGFHYAMQNRSNIKAIAFFEALVRPFTWENFATPQFRELFKQFRTGGIGGLGWQMIVDQNIFIEQLLPQASGRKLSDKEMDYYREPFRDPPSRLPIWRFAQETAIGGTPSDVWNAVSEYSRKLKESNLPKLLLYATPGALLTQEHVQWCEQNFNNLVSVDIGPGIHFLEESSPHRIGQEIAKWYRNLH